MSAQLDFVNRPKAVQNVVDSLLMIKRSSTHILRNTDQLLGTFFQPIMFLILFSAVFGGAVSKALPEGISYLNFLMAGIIIQTLAFGSTTTAIAVSNDLQKGIISFKSHLLHLMGKRSVQTELRWHKKLANIILTRRGLLAAF